MSKYKTKFVDNFGTLEYDFSGAGDLSTVTNITKFISVSQSSDSSFYVKYNISEGERPDMVSTKLYGTPQYYWVFFMLNDFLKNGLSSWPKTDIEMEKFFTKEYSPYFWLSSGVFDKLLLNIPYPPHFPNSRPTVHMSSLLLTDYYLPALRLTYPDDDYPLTSMSFKKYDHDRHGLIVKRGSSEEMSRLDLFSPGNNPTFAITHDGSLLGKEWQKACNDLGLEGNNTGDESKRASFYVDCSRSNSQEFLKNAVYQYFITVDGIDTTVSHFDVLHSSIDAKKITFYEYENIINNNKKQINVPKPEILEELSRGYFDKLSLTI